jgi:hypothetical protein
MLNRSEGRAEGLPVSGGDYQCYFFHDLVIILLLWNVEEFDVRVCFILVPPEVVIFVVEEKV